MPLILPSEVSQIAFVNAIDPALILPEFISSAQTSYVLPVVTQSVVDNIEANPTAYDTLLNTYIKPYLAFAVKYMFYNQLITETSGFAVSNEQRVAALQEIIAIIQIKQTLLKTYLNENIFESPVTTEKKSVSGFLFRSSKSADSAFSPEYSVTASLLGATLDTPADADTFNFIAQSSGLLRKISLANFRQALSSYFSLLWSSLWLSEISFEFRDLTPGTAQSYVLDLKASFPYSILSASLEIDTGSLSGVAVAINGTAIPSLSGLTVGPSTIEPTASADNSVMAGNRVTLTTSTTFSGSPGLIRGKINIRKAL